MDREDSYTWVRRPYVFLLILSLVLSVLYVYALLEYPSQNELRTWLSSFAVTIAGSYVTVVLIDRSFRQRERREQQRIRRIALTNIKRGIGIQLGLITNIYISSIPRVPEELPESYTDLFNRRFCFVVSLVDLSEQYPIAGTNRTYLHHSAVKFERSHEILEDAINTYGFVMDSELMQDIENLTDSTMAMMLIRAHKAGLQSKDEFEFPRLMLAQAGIDIIEEHLSHLLTLVEYFDDPSLPDFDPGKSSAWDEDASPSAGEAIPKEIDRARYEEFWNSPSDDFDIEELILDEYVDDSNSEQTERN